MRELELKNDTFKSVSVDTLNGTRKTVLSRYRVARTIPPGGYRSGGTPCAVIYCILIKYITAFLVLF